MSRITDAKNKYQELPKHIKSDVRREWCEAAGIKTTMSLDNRLDGKTPFTIKDFGYFEEIVNKHHAFLKLQTTDADGEP